MVTSTLQLAEKTAFYHNCIIVLLCVAAKQLYKYTTLIIIFSVVIIINMKTSIAVIIASSVAVQAYNKQELVLQDPAKIGEVSCCSLELLISRCII